MKNLLFTVALAVSYLPLTAQTIVPSQSDKILLDNGNSKADVGETIRYKVTIQNTGAADATNVQLNVADVAKLGAPGSFTSTSVAVDDAYSCTGNVPITISAAAGVLANDFDDDLSMATLTCNSCNPGGGGRIVTLNNDGSFTYTPPAGFTGNDQFTYTINDGTVPPDCTPDNASITGTVTVAVSNLIYFIDNSGGAGDGRLDSPFNSLTAFNANSTAAGDVIYVEQTGTDYTGGIVLANNERLFGEGHSGGASLSDVLPFTLAANSAALPVINGTNPAVKSAAGGTAISLASSNTLRGLDIGRSGSRQNGTGLSGSGVGALTIDEMSVFVGGANAGKGINLNSGGTLDIQLVELSLTSCAPIAIDCDGVMGSFEVLFATNIDDAATRGVELTNSGSATFTFNQLDINNTASNATGLFASNAGTVNTTSGSLNTGSGTAVDIDNTLLGIAFTSVSSSGGASVGIDLNTTTGSFTVSGNGATGAGITANNGSGGTISSKSGNAIFLQNATNVSLNYMNIGQAGALGNIADNGIRAIDVNGFILTRSNLRNIANQNFPDEAALFATNPKGTWNILNTLFDRSFDDHIRIQNNTTSSGLTINLKDSDIRDNNASTTGNDGFLYIADATGANATIAIENNNFDNSDGDHVQIALNGNVNADVTIDGNTMTAILGAVLGSGITLSSGQGTGGVDFAGSLTYLIQNNDIQNAAAAAINVNLSASSTSGAAYQGSILNNTMGTVGTANSGGFGISIKQNGDGTLGSVINNNTIQSFDGDHGLLLEARDGNGRLNATITQNTIANPSDPNNFDGLGINAGAIGTDNSIICADIKNNSMAGLTSDFAIFSAASGNSPGTQIILPGYTGAAKDNPAIIAFIQGNNTGTPTGTIFFAANSQGVSGAGTSCP